jgi:hypothetical protein
MSSREQKRTSPKWSVRDRFRHQPHPVSRAACTKCHSNILDADTLDDIDPPAKSACVGCHDGAEAFKITGHRCDR